MSNAVLIGVGGSGQHVVHAYLRLLALTNVDPTTIPKIYIIDADDSSAGEKESLSNQIEQLYTSLISTVKKDEQGQSEKTRNVKVIRPFYQENENHTPHDAANALGVSHVVDPLANAFLMDDGDRTVEVAKGMMANARIGSAVFHTKKIQSEIKRTQTTNFGDFFNDVQGARVAIVGSSFGGTGSGVTPTLIRALEEIENDSERPTITQAFMTLPWFEIKKGKKNDPSAAGTKNGISPMQRNAMLGLRSYLEESKIFTQSNYVISQFVTNQAPPEREDNGNFNQHETKHVYNLILANSIQHFLSTDSLDDNFKAPNLDNPKQGRQILGLLLGEGEEKGIFDATKSPHLRLHIGKDDNRSLQEIFMDANMTAFVLKKAAEAMRAARDSRRHELQVVGADQSSPLPTELKRLLAAIDPSKVITEKGFMDKIKSFRSSDDVPDKFQPEVYTNLASSLENIATRLQFSIDWLYEHKVDTATHQKTGFIFKPENLTKEWEVNWKEYSFRDLKRRAHANTIIVDGDGKAINSNKIAQAFFLFENIFFAGQTNSRNGYTVVFDLDKAKAAQPQKSIYDVAAELITKQIFEEVRAARVTNPIDDSQDVNTDTKRTKLMLKADVMRQHAKSKKSLTPRLATIEGLYQDIQSDYEMIDPYLGISASSIEQLRAKTIVFPETALKGIPNIIAPLLLQNWRLELFDKNKEVWSAHRPDPLTTDDSLSSTDYGVYLHARRIIEAAFWLLFISNSSVQLATLGDDSQGFISTLLKKELAEFKLRNIKYYIHSNDTKTKGMPLFLYDDKIGWYLAANQTARQFFASIMPDLPSVKYGHSKLDSLWRGEEYETQPTAKPETYDTGVISAFLGYLNELSHNPQFANNKPTWLKACDDLVADLQSKGFMSNNLANTSLQNSGIALPLLGQQAGITLKTLKGVENASLANLAIPNPILYYKTDTNDNMSPLQPKELLWPLKGEAWQYLVPPQDAINAFGEHKLLSNNDRSVWSWESLILDFKGLGKKTFDRPFTDVVGVDAREDQFLWSVGVWPNFVLDDWNYYIAIGDFNSIEIKNIDLKKHDLKAESVEFIFYGDVVEASAHQPNQKQIVFKEIGRSFHAIPIKLKGIPRSVEIVLGKRVLGSVPIALNESVVAKSNPCKIALDFGTSNTCMAVNFEPNNANPKSLPLLEGQPFEYKIESEYKSIELKNLTWSTGSYVASGGKYYHELLPTLFFQSFASPNQSVASIPSELLWAKGMGKALESADNRLKYLQDTNTGMPYYTEFSILKSFGGSSPEQCLSGQVPVVAPFWTPFPPVISDDLKGQLTGSTQNNNNTYVEGFKWDSGLSDKRYAHRAVYLENILVASFATLRLSGCRELTEVIATYPGAFSSKNIDHKIADTVSYKTDISLIIEKLSQQTGVTVAQTSEHEPAIKLRSETCAALAGCSRERSEISLTIDMGGGTTDIGLIIPDKDQPNDTGKLKYYMASLRYAGTHLLDAIVNYDTVKKEKEGQNESVEKIKKALFLDWKLKLRAGKKIELGADRPAYDRITHAFFEGLFEYVFNMLMAFKESLPRDKEVKVYLLGNGFKLAQVFCGLSADEAAEERSFFTGMMTKAKECGLLDANIQLKLQQPQGIDKKQALINGVFNIREEAEAGQQYAYIEQQGYGTEPLILPCVLLSGQAKNQPYLQKHEDFINALEAKAVSTSDDWQQRKTAFKLTNNYWQHQNVNQSSLFTEAVMHEHASDFGKFYLENKFVREILYKLVTEQTSKQQATPVNARHDPIPASSTNPASQQSGFKPTAANAPPTPNAPPQNVNNAAAVVLSSGANTPIDGNNITINLKWQSPFDLDVIVFALNDKGNVTADENTIFYNQPNYAQGAVELNAEQRQVHINLSKIPAHIKTIAICAVTGIDDESARGKNFGQVSNSAINVSAQNSIIFELSNVKGTETAMIFGEVYRYKDTWKFRAKGQGYAGGFKKMCDEYGAEY